VEARTITPQASITAIEPSCRKKSHDTVRKKRRRSRFKRGASRFKRGTFRAGSTTCVNNEPESRKKEVEYALAFRLKRRNRGFYRET